NALLVSYRFLGSSGNDLVHSLTYLPPLAPNPPPDPVEARWRTNWIDLDYRGCLHGPWLHTTFQWQTGVRLAALSFAERRTDPYQGTQTEQKATFFGAGPHFGLDFSHYFGATGLGLFARGDLGIVVGRTTTENAFTYQPTPYQTV